jgi:CRISPR-associated protein Cas2
MVILIMKKVTKSRRGLISRLMSEPRANVFIGNLSARIRDKLWEKVSEKWNIDSLMVFTTNTEQGYDFRINGDPNREVIDFDGLKLVSFKKKKIGKKEIFDIKNS